MWFKYLTRWLPDGFSVFDVPYQHYSTFSKTIDIECQDSEVNIRCTGPQLYQY